MLFCCLNVLVCCVDSVDYSEYSGYEIADMLKLYFRELPEPLLTSKLSEALIVTHECEYSCVAFLLVLYSWEKGVVFICSAV